MEEEEKVSNSLRLTILRAQLGQSPVARNLRGQSWRGDVRCECHWEAQSDAGSLL